MVFVGIDVAKDKHDCFILNSEGTVLADVYVCLWCPAFSAYLEKKRAEGKHYNVAVSHAAKKLVRLIFAMQRSGKAYCTNC